MLLLLLACTQAPEDPWISPDQPGAYDVGRQTWTWTDDRGKELTAEVWYPATVGPAAEPLPYEPFQLAIDAHYKAPMVEREAPWPVIAFSHGYGAIRFQSAFLTEYLASHGFVVVAVDHNHNTLLDLDEDRDVDVFLERPQDVIASVDRLAADPDFGPAVDTERYAVVGHSFGAWTTLVVGGGQLDFSGIEDHCATYGGRACRAVSKLSVDDLPDALPDDPRAVVSVPMSPGIWYAFGPEGQGLETVRAPLVLAGTLDGVLDYEREIVPVFDAMAAPKTLANFQDAGHYHFSDICLVAPFITEECDDPAYMDMALAQEVTKPLVLGHIGWHLLGDERYAPWAQGQDLPDSVWLE